MKKINEKIYHKYNKSGKEFTKDHWLITEVKNDKYKEISRVGERTAEPEFVCPIVVEGRMLEESIGYLKSDDKN